MHGCDPHGPVGRMANIQIKDVPEDVHRTLKHRAMDAHQSLNEYLRQRLIEEARSPTVRAQEPHTGMAMGRRSIICPELGASRAIDGFSLNTAVTIGGRHDQESR